MSVSGGRPARTPFRRWTTFNAVGVLGFGLQLAVLAFLKDGAGLDYLVATGLAVEVSVLHNFLWHERWTWSDRPAGELAAVLDRLVRFHGATAVLSIAGNLVLTGLLVEAAGLHYLIANSLAVAGCSVLNFLVADLLVFTSVGLLALLVAPGAATPVAAAELSGPTLQAWQRYVRHTEERITGELASRDGFLAFELQPSARSARDRDALLHGRILVEEMETRDDDGESIDVPDGAIHHWRGAVFIPDVALDRVLHRVAYPDDSAARQEDVLESRVLDRGPGWLRVHLRLRRDGIVSVTYDTEHLVRYRRQGEGRAFSRTGATRIVEIADPGTPEERARPPGRDRGFLWRMNSYWRYRQIDGGVLVECETLTLSRSVPAFLRLVADPLIDAAARGSMERTLRSMRERLAGLTAEGSGS